ncbi:uncharacterized protein ARMOST_22523 [Armillaria ostoyae]|uniref:Reverse transcriptase domain-containing protein n=1 Tax=Armillaria ostoyae TaxID=47428 RepID=A0A284SD46_ARMOS|nr:uncharacterized protein ARMOST_22523 [Armillaria ostoyae]
MYISAAHKTTSTIDLVFAMRDILVLCIVRCNAVLGESAWHQMLRVDLDLELARNSPPSHPLYREVDWENFNQRLQDHFKDHPINVSEATLQTEDAIDDTVDWLIAGLEKILSQVVPMSKPSKYSKCWWMKGLSLLRKKYHKAQRQWLKRGTAEWWAKMMDLKKRYQREIKRQKKDHWQEWVTKILDRDIWSAAKYATEPGKSTGPTKTPVLKDSGGQVQVNPGAKAKLLASSFFPERLNLERRRNVQTTSFILDSKITLKHISSVIKRVKAYSAPGPSGILNIVLQVTISTYAPILLGILQASL